MRTIIAIALVNLVSPWFFVVHIFHDGYGDRYVQGFVSWHWFTLFFTPGDIRVESTISLFQLGMPGPFRAVTPVSEHVFLVTGLLAFAFSIVATTLVLVARTKSAWIALALPVFSLVAYLSGTVAFLYGSSLTWGEFRGVPLPPGIVLVTLLALFIRRFQRS